MSSLLSLLGESLDPSAVSLLDGRLGAGDGPGDLGSLLGGLPGGSER